MTITTQTTFDAGHADMVHDCQLDYYGRRLATCSSDRIIKVFDVVGDAVTPLADLAGHEGPVWGLSWSHPKFGSLLASASFDHRVCIWREAAPGGAWHAVFTDPVHTASVNDVAFGPVEGGCVVAAASSDGALSVLTHSGGDPAAGGGAWSVDRIEGAHPAGALSITWAPAGVTGRGAGGPAPAAAAAPLERCLASGGCDGLVKVWRFSAAAGRWALDGPPLAAHADWVRDVAWAPAPGGAGSAVAGPAMLASAGQDGRVFIWTEDTAAGAGAGGWAPTLLADLGVPAWRVSWAVSGGVLAVTDAKGEVTTWKEALDGQWEQVGA